MAARVRTATAAAVLIAGAASWCAAAFLLIAYGDARLTVAGLLLLATPPLLVVAWLLWRAEIRDDLTDRLERDLQARADQAHAAAITEIRQQKPDLGRPALPVIETRRPS